MGNDTTDTKFSELKYNGWRQAEATVTYAGGTTNAIGDFNGSGNPVTMFTVTGTVEMSIIALCETTLTGGSATIEVGTALSTAGLIAQTTGTDIDINEIWAAAAPASSVELTSVTGRYIVNQDVKLTVGTADATAGVIRFIVKWAPISADGKVEVT